jgi:hypothetical protein
MICNIIAVNSCSLGSFNVLRDRAWITRQKKMLLTRMEPVLIAHMFIVGFFLYSQLRMKIFEPLYTVDPSRRRQLSGIAISLHTLAVFTQRVKHKKEKK